MSFDIIFSPSFKQSIRRLEKRYPSVKKDVRLAIEVLSENPNLGVLIPGGFGVRKLRIRNSDVKRGKSGGYCLLYHIRETEAAICLLLLYAKSDKENITSNEIRLLLEDSIEAE